MTAGCPLLTRESASHPYTIMPKKAHCFIHLLKHISISHRSYHLSQKNLKLLGMLRTILKIFILVLGNVVPTFLDVLFYDKNDFPSENS